MTLRTRDMTFEHTVENGMIKIAATYKGYTMCTYVSQDEASNKEVVRLKVEALAESLRNLTRWNDGRN